jgi:hypothetical protein
MDSFTDVKLNFVENSFSTVTGIFVLVLLVILVALILVFLLPPGPETQVSTMHRDPKTVICNGCM